MYVLLCHYISGSVLYRQRTTVRCFGYTSCRQPGEDVYFPQPFGSPCHRSPCSRVFAPIRQPTCELLPICELLLR
jgi:hypothetical protein